MAATHVKRAYKFRFYPTDAQAAELSRTFGCVRKVYNMALQARTEAWSLRGERISYNASSAMLTAWKRTAELSYLSEVSSVPLQQALRHLQGAFTNFFAKRARYPRFKSKKKSRDSAEYTTSAFRYRDGRLTLAKMSEPLAIAWSRPLPEGRSPSTVTVSRDAAGRWFVSMLCDDPGVEPLPMLDSAVGVDAGITSLVALSTGEKIANPRHERRDRERLVRAQRDLARKANGSANREKARRKVARVHARIADRRRDFLHKLTTRLVRENQTVVIEDLTVRNMLRNGRLSRAISDASWSDLRTMLEYKAQWYGRDLVTIDRWFPSSKLCSACGTIRDRMPLNVRAWECDCGAVHDRDVNAARNILAAGLAVAACGDGVRPQRSTPGGRSSVKQEVVPPLRSRAAAQP
ncbi:RNA-guided endonuclease TnpB family protein [Kitasatospora sp. SUK 42]|uniref:RNA-guided endonuclease InsQ/TnpB family protein n=1 Tax=Kitasatospora sp. SUK 42 TaxID=1588882 RepID=UPI0018CA0B97|nr:RNA-guided endonuclease TnpB family protein [Kitasatospora sp. SUK 42]MBV2153371.1 transposase [Kitasatospora sp. SUK 42]